MKTLFTIGNRSAEQGTLLFELDQDHCCYAFFDKAANAFTGISYISFNEFEAEENLGRILDQFQDASFENVVVCSAFAQALLVPQKNFNGDHSLLDIYGLPAQKHLDDAVAEWQITTLYALPSAIYTMISSRFPSARFIHSYTPALKIYNGYTATDQIDIQFTPQNFRVLVKKEGQVQLAQIYSYKTPLDVVYYLLKLCYEFHFEQSDVFLVLSGLLEKDSALYEELHQYFLNVHFAQAPSYSLPENDHPHYYFTSLYNLAACVS